MIGWTFSRSVQNWLKSKQRKYKLQLDEMNGELLRVEDVEEEWTRCIADCRARLLVLPSKMTNSVFGAETEAEFTTF